MYYFILKCWHVCFVCCVIADNVIDLKIGRNIVSVGKKIINVSLEKKSIQNSLPFGHRFLNLSLEQYKLWNPSNFVLFPPVFNFMAGWHFRNVLQRWLSDYKSA